MKDRHAYLILAHKNPWQLRMLLDALDYELRKVFRHSTMCDEIFIPTILAQSPFMQRLYNSETAENTTINNSNLRLIDWNRGPSIRHPWVFTIDDIDMLKTAPQLWARKFDENTDREAIVEVCKMTQDRL